MNVEKYIKKNWKFLLSYKNFLEKKKKLGNIFWLMKKYKKII